MKGGVILYCIILYINPGILFEDWSGGLCRCRRHLFLRHLFLQSLPHTLFSPRQHGTVQARASTATARLARPRIMIRTSRPGPGGPAGRPNPPGPGCGRLRQGRAPACRGGPCLACWADYYNPLFLQQGSFIRGEGEGAGTALMGARQIILK